MKCSTRVFFKIFHLVLISKCQKKPSFRDFFFKITELTGRWDVHVCVTTIMIDEIPNYSKISCLYRVFAECDVSVCFLSRARAPGGGGMGREKCNSIIRGWLILCSTHAVVHQNTCFKFCPIIQNHNSYLQKGYSIVTFKWNISIDWDHVLV